MSSASKLGAQTCRVKDCCERTEGLLWRGHLLLLLLVLLLLLLLLLHLLLLLLLLHPHLLLLLLHLLLLLLLERLRASRGWVGFSTNELLRCRT